MTAGHLEYRSHWTVQDLEQIPDEFRAEIVHGELRMTPSASKRHRSVIIQLIDQLRGQLPDGWMCVFDFDVVFAQDHSRRPDLGIVRRDSIDVNPTPAEEPGARAGHRHPSPTNSYATADGSLLPTARRRSNASGAPRTEIGRAAVRRSVDASR